MPDRGGKKEPEDPLDFEVNMGEMEMKWPEVPPQEFSLVRTDATQTEKYILDKVYEQGDVGSCVTNAISSAYRYEIQRQLKEKKKPLVDDFRPSRLFLYYVGRLTKARGVGVQKGQYYADLATNPPTEEIRKDYGSFIREVIKILGALGTTNEDDLSTHQEGSGSWPYKSESPVKSGPDDKDGDFPSHTYPSMAPDKQCFTNAFKHMTLAYAKPKMEVACWKKCIYAGYPIIFGYRDYDNLDQALTPPFDPGFNFVAPTPKEDDTGYGGHVVLAVGWSENLKAFRIQNSWGDDRGDNGFFYMPYSWLDMDSPNPKDLANKVTKKRHRMVYDAWTLKGSSELNHR